MLNKEINTMRSSFRHIPDDEHSVSLEEAKYISNNTNYPLHGLFTVLDIVKLFNIFNNRYYYKETLIKVFPIIKKEKA